MASDITAELLPLNYLYLFFEGSSTYWVPEEVNGETLLHVFEGHRNYLENIQSPISPKKVEDVVVPDSPEQSTYEEIPHGTYGSAGRRTQAFTTLIDISYNDAPYEQAKLGEVPDRDVPVFPSGADISTKMRPVFMVDLLSICTGEFQGSADPEVTPRSRQFYVRLKQPPRPCTRGELAIAVSKSLQEVVNKHLLMHLSQAVQIERLALRRILRVSKGTLLVVISAMRE
ncbi:hypothetical protein C8Q79DRAFT_924199 [Trametes meyenii]|nr:hypothetical protein C8Q79DRAFT_924199 [Trametes meyenii]